MSDHKDVSFRNMNIKDKTATIVGIALLIILVVSIIFGFYFFGMVGIFELLGVKYHSILSLVLFIVSYFLLGVIVELFSKSLFELYIENITGENQIFISRIIFEGTSNWLVLFIVDEFMKSISLTTITEIIIAMLFAILETVFDDKKSVANSDKIN